MDEELRAELLTRRDEDQRVRQIRWPHGQYREIPDEIREMMRVDQANTAWLTELIARRGWPGRTLVGKDGAHAAWLLAQHADPGHCPALPGEPQSGSADRLIAIQVAPQTTQEPLVTSVVVFNRFR